MSAKDISKKPSKCLILTNLINSNVMFQRRKKNCFSFIKKFILSFPSFNLNNQPNLNLDLELTTETKTNNESSFIDETFLMSQNEDEKKNFVELNEVKTIQRETKNPVLKFIKSEKSNLKNEIKDLYEYTEELFDIIIKDETIKESFATEINDIIKTMQEIIYTIPYPILFGRINIQPPKREIKTALKDINELFYEGLDIEEFKYKM